MISFHRKITIIAPFPFSEIWIILRTNKNENFANYSNKIRRNQSYQSENKHKQSNGVPRNFGLDEIVSESSQ